jgi:hypothetical protein
LKMALTCCRSGFKDLHFFLSPFCNHPFISNGVLLLSESRLSLRRLLLAPRKHDSSTSVRDGLQDLLVIYIHIFISHSILLETKLFCFSVYHIQRWMKCEMLRWSKKCFQLIMLGYIKTKVEALLHIELVGQKCYEIRRKYCLSSELFN